MCHRRHWCSLPGRTAKKLLPRLSSPLPQLPNLPNQEACVWTVEGGKRDCSLTNTGRQRHKGEGLRFLVVPLPRSPPSPLQAEIGKGHRICDLDISHPLRHPWPNYHQSKTPQFSSQYLLTRVMKGEVCPPSLPRICPWHWSRNRNSLRKLIGRIMVESVKILPFRSNWSSRGQYVGSPCCSI
jgi:hypothetical protein